MYRQTMSMPVCLLMMIDFCSARHLPPYTYGKLYWMFHLNLLLRKLKLEYFQIITWQSFTIAHYLHNKLLWTWCHHQQVHKFSIDTGKY